MEPVDFQGEANSVSASPPPDPELERRARLLSKLFVAYRDNDMTRAKFYLEQTMDVPPTWLAAGILSIIDTRVYPTLPTIGELKLAAKEQAGMLRDRYHGGRYIGKPKIWPPPGQRYSVEIGRLEPVAKHSLLKLSVPKQGRLTEGK
jgi:hypothetical protein